MKVRVSIPYEGLPYDHKVYDYEEAKEHIRFKEGLVYYGIYTVETLQLCIEIDGDLYVWEEWDCVEGYSG